MKDEMRQCSPGTARLRLRPVRFMRVLVAIVFVALAAELLCLPLLMAGETTTIPQRFHARIGGFMGRTYEVQLQDGSLRYTTFGRGHTSEPVEVRPTKE